MKQQLAELQVHFFQRIPSPVGTLIIVEEAGALRAVAFESNWPTIKKSLGKLVVESTPFLTQVQLQLEQYFSGEREKFELPLSLRGTEFQQKVWRALAHIPFGITRTYVQQAELIDSPNAVRAVGRAEGLNPICIVLPCHRVVASNGALTGFAGGLDVKEYLLLHEGISVSASRSLKGAASKRIAPAR